ncbi:hypothetical protein ASPWEDRAFT_466882 [Aspergillus wentii DTO 134E9]|uniref:Uncharacterized protein n=1 Tax=Aspergillus wentii DTO 134E9 TaxID=1073089 RepID=A0A1L9RS28_ASPWE|nr:uncharacterized protein ASPWEDRAFT_466882 [Aspergillus wentii DTO 134E9]OJJ37722.1 hypothetical protein ASPWEDRAFT_466882 [Aspergillus wentii DTO 134E9]
MLPRAELALNRKRKHHFHRLHHYLFFECWDLRFNSLRGRAILSCHCQFSSEIFFVISTPIPQNKRFFKTPPLPIRLFLPSQGLKLSSFYLPQPSSQLKQKKKTTKMANQDMSAVAQEALADFTNQIFGGLIELVKRLYNNTYESFAQVSMRRWTRVFFAVVVYIIIRPYIEKLFKKMQDRDRQKEIEKKRTERQAAADKTANISANELRGGGGSGSGKVLGEVENTDDEIDEEDTATATATGVPEMGKNARKRQKKYMKNLEKEQAESNTHNLTDEQVLELLDWSESEEEKKH